MRAYPGFNPIRIHLPMNPSRGIGPEPRAVIVDVYGTVLEVQPPPADAPIRWEAVWQEHFAKPPRLSLAAFAEACAALIAQEHAAARAGGIPYPEVYWPKVVTTVVPELRDVLPERRDRFIDQQAALWHTVRLFPEGADVLAALRQRGCRLGIASNAQPYTLRELTDALAPSALRLEDFDPALTFWSFAHGFSKPDPHVFRVLGIRLTALAIAPSEVLMVGDRRDNDIEPAAAAGWRTWHLRPNGPADATGGDWPALARALGIESANREQ